MENYRQKILQKELKRYLKPAAVVLGLLCTAAVVLLLWGRTSKVADQEVYDFYSQMVRAEVAAYFSSEYQADLGADEADWQKRYGREVPAKMRDEKVQENMKYDQALRTLAEQYKVSPMMPVGRELLQQWEEFNLQRENSLEQGEIVYGPEQYDLQAYYFECRGNAETALVKYFLENAVANHEDLLRERYEEAETSELTRRRTATLRAYTIDPEEFSAQPEAVDKALKVMLDYVTQNSDCSLEDLVAVSGFQLGYKELVLDSGAISREDSLSATLLSLSQENSCFIGPLQNSSNYSCVYQVVESSYGERPSFESALMTVAALYANETLDKEISQITDQ